MVDDRELISKIHRLTLEEKELVSAQISQIIASRPQRQLLTETEVADGYAKLSSNLQMKISEILASAESVEKAPLEAATLTVVEPAPLVFEDVAVEEPAPLVVEEAKVGFFKRVFGGGGK